MRNSPTNYLIMSILVFGVLKFFFTYNTVLRSDNIHLLRGQGSQTLGWPKIVFNAIFRGQAGLPDAFYRIKKY